MHALACTCSACRGVLRPGCPPKSHDKIGNACCRNMLMFALLIAPDTAQPQGVCSLACRHRSLVRGRALEAGMVITVEPGCYFNEFTLRPALADASVAHLLVPERIEPFMVRAWGGRQGVCNLSSRSCSGCTLYPKPHMPCRGTGSLQQCPVFKRPVIVWHFIGTALAHDLDSSRSSLQRKSHISLLCERGPCRAPVACGWRTTW